MRWISVWHGKLSCGAALLLFAVHGWCTTYALTANNINTVSTVTLNKPNPPDDYTLNTIFLSIGTQTTDIYRVEPPNPPPVSQEVRLTMGNSLTWAAFGGSPAGRWMVVAPGKKLTLIANNATANITTADSVIAVQSNAQLDATFSSGSLTVTKNTSPVFLFDNSGGRIEFQGTVSVKAAANSSANPLISSMNISSLSKTLTLFNRSNVLSIGTINYSGYLDADLANSHEGNITVGQLKLNLSSNILGTVNANNATANNTVTLQSGTITALTWANNMTLQYTLSSSASITTLTPSADIAKNNYLIFGSGSNTTSYTPATNYTNMRRLLVNNNATFTTHANSNLTGLSGTHGTALDVRGTLNVTGSNIVAINVNAVAINSGTININSSRQISDMNMTNSGTIDGTNNGTYRNWGRTFTQNSGSTNVANFVGGNSSNNIVIKSGNFKANTFSISPPDGTTNFTIEGGNVSVTNYNDGSQSTSNFIMSGGIFIADNFSGNIASVNLSGGDFNANNFICNRITINVSGTGKLYLDSNTRLGFDGSISVNSGGQVEGWISTSDINGYGKFNVGNLLAITNNLMLPIEKGIRQLNIVNTGTKEVNTNHNGGGNITISDRMSIEQAGTLRISDRKITANTVESRGNLSVERANGLSFYSCGIISGTLFVKDGASIVNDSTVINATMSISAGVTVSGSGTIENKNMSAGDTVLNISTSSVPLNIINDSIINIYANGLNLSGTVTNNGNNGKIQFQFFNGGNAQNVTFSGKLNTYPGSTMVISTPNPGVSSTTIKFPTNSIFTYQGGTIRVTKVEINGGQWNISGNYTPTISDEFSAIDVNSGGIAIATNITWTSKTGCVMNFNGGSMTGGGTFVNRGTVNYKSTAVDAWQFATFTNHATNPGTLNVQESMSPQITTFNNAGAGVVNISNGKQYTNLATTAFYMTGTSKIQGSGTFVNAGTFEASSGNPEISSAFTNTNQFTVKASTTLTLKSLLTNKVSGNSTGKITVETNGTLTQSLSSIDVQAGSLLEIKGTMNGNGNLTCGNNGTVNVIGTLTGTTQVANSGTINMSGTYSSGGSILNRAADNTYNRGVIISSGSFAGNSVINNQGTFKLTGGTFNGSGSFTNSVGADITLQNGLFTMPVGLFTNNGITNLNGGFINGPYIGGANSVLNSNFNTGNGGTYTGLETININNSNFIVNNPIEGTTTINVNIGSQLNIKSLLDNSDPSSPTGKINLNGATMVFNPGAINPNLRKYSTVSVNSNSTINVNTDTELSGTNIVGVDGNTATTLSINNASTFTTNAQIANIRRILINGGTLSLKSNATVFGFDSFEDNGVLSIESGAIFTISPNDNFFGTGSIDNSGILTIDGGNLTLGGSFINANTGNLIINGAPTLTFNGADFTNDGYMQLVFNTSGGIANIVALNAAVPDLNSGIIQISYDNTYVAQKNYTFMQFGGVPTVGVTYLPPASRYIKSWTLATVGNDLVVQVERNKFGTFVTNPTAILIADYLENLGAGSPTQQQLDLLNSLEKIDNDDDLTIALLSLLSPQNIQMQNIAIQDATFGVLEMRLAEHKMHGYLSGDDIDHDNSIWVRPFGTYGKQRNRNTILAYNGRTSGVIFGLDQQINPVLLLGVAGSYASSQVTQAFNELTTTKIHTYQGMVYGTVRSDTGAYLDLLLSAGVNNYNSDRNININNFLQMAYAKYQTQQVTAKAMASQLFAAGWLQVTPQANAQYSFIRQLSYVEHGANNFDLIVTPSNINLVRLGAGVKFAVPLSDRTMISIPSVHCNVYVDVVGGASNVDQQFITGGPILSTSTQAARVMYQLGANYEFSISDRIQLALEYDVDIRNGFTGQEGYINIKYIF